MIKIINLTERVTAMDKQKFYVTVGTGEVLPDKTLSEWEFEIEATEEEAGHLSGLFEETDIDSAEDFWHAHIPFVPYSKNLDADHQGKRSPLRDLPVSPSSRHT